MEIKIEIKTPIGYAKSTEQKLRPWIVGTKTKPKEMYVNKKDDTLYWVVEAPVKTCLRIQKNVTLYESLVKGILDSRMVKKAIRDKFDKKKEKELRDMLFKHTTITIIKQATANEIVGNNKTLWDNIKERFTKVS